jgi:LPS sulfotransferase NodH
MENFFIFTTQRSGSTLLMHLLDSSKDLRIFPEIFHRESDKNFEDELLRFSQFRSRSEINRPLDVFKYLNYYENSVEKEKYKGFGFKLMYGDMISLPELFIFLLFIKKYKIIHLVRENIFDKVCSHLFAKQSNIWTTSKTIKTSKIEVSPSEIVSLIKTEKRKECFFKNILKLSRNPVLFVAYNDLIENQADTLESIYSFLQFKFELNFTETPPTKKQISTPLSDLFYNWKEIEIKMKKEGLGHYLNKCS